MPKKKNFDRISGIYDFCKLIFFPYFYYVCSSRSVLVFSDLLFFFFFFEIALSDIFLRWNNI